MGLFGDFLSSTGPEIFKDFSHEAQGVVESRINSIGTAVNALRNYVVLNPTEIDPTDSPFALSDESSRQTSGLNLPEVKTTSTAQEVVVTNNTHEVPVVSIGIPDTASSGTIESLQIQASSLAMPSSIMRKDLDSAEETV